MTRALLAICWRRTVVAESSVTEAPLQRTKKYACDCWRVRQSRSCCKADSTGSGSIKDHFSSILKAVAQ